MANDEVLGPRKTMFVLVIVVGCFAVLWPRILSPLILGHSAEQLKPNKYDREAGCCEVIFETEVAVLQLVNEVCNSVHGEGKYSPQSAAECRKAVNETCGVDIVAFLKRNENVGKTTKILVEAMKNSNTSCLRQNFGVPVYSMGTHFALNSWNQQDTLKQERPSIRMSQHPALLERGRAIPPGPPPPSRPVVLPPHIRVRSPLSVYYELDIKPPPIPGMRPPLGSPGGPVPAPKSSMGFVMPIYTICIIVFFVYTLSKILFKRTGTPYDSVTPDPQFRRRVFRDDSRSSPDKLVVSAISGLVAEVQQQMEAGYPQNQQRQELLDSARHYTNGTIIHSGPVQIVTSEYKERSPEPQKPQEPAPEIRDSTPEPLAKPEENKLIEESEKPFEVIENKDPSKDLKEVEELIPNESYAKSEEIFKVIKEANGEIKSIEDFEEHTFENIKDEEVQPVEIPVDSEDKVNSETEEIKADFADNITFDTITAETQQNAEYNDHEPIQNNEDTNIDIPKHSEAIDLQISDSLIDLTEELLNEEPKDEKQDASTEDLLAEAIKDLTEDGEHVEEDKENQSVKVVGMELTAHAADGGSYRPEPPKAAPPQRTHEADEVKSIFLETEIPQQSRVLVSDFAEDRQDQQEDRKHTPLVVSGKITLSLIQDAPRDTPDRDLESTLDEFTTASALTQPPAEKDEELESSEEEIDEELEVEEIEEIEEEEEEEEDDEEPKKEAVKEK